MRKRLFPLLGILFFCAQLFAQNRTVSGKITDDKGNAIPNASVLVKGTTVGTSTDNTGSFSLSVPSNAKSLVISAVGMGEKEVNLTTSDSYTVSLSSSSVNMQEVVVVGYTTTTREAFTGSAKQVSGEQLANKSVSNPSQALAGEVAGVRVINTSGQPGSVATIRIRGIGSVNGNRDPLYVIDGVPFTGALNGINPSDIASMTVLKDAAATSIYGSRGANGVIVITTRNGRGKKPFIEVEARYGTNKAILPRYDVIESPEEYISLSWEAVYNRGVALGQADPVAYANNRLFSANGVAPAYNIWNAANAAALIDPVTKSVRPGTTRKYDPEDWEDYAFQPSNRSEVNVKFGGGDAKTNYYSSFGFLDDKGYSIKSDFRRLSARLNLNHEVKSWLSTGMNINYSNATTNNNGQASNSNSVFWFVDNIPSIYPLFLRDASGNKVADPIFGGFQYDYGAGAQSRGFGGLTNAIADASYNTLRAKRNDIFGNASATLKFTKNLSLENRFGMQYYNNAGVTLTNKYYGSAATQNGSISQTKTELLNTNLLTMLRYAQRFNQAHNVEFLAAHEASNNRTSIANASGYNLITDYSLELNNAVVSNPVSSYSNTNKLESYFSQLSYDYEGTYYLSGTVRRDGSSRFKNDKWGTFGSVGLGWVLTKMNFLKQQNLVSYLKLKASYGLLGDQAGVGNYPGFDRWDLANLNNNAAITFSTRGNEELTWETSKMFQTGVDFRLGSFLDGTVEYYVKNTDNLIFDRRTAPSLGYALITVNDGQLRNQGIEFDLTGHILNNKNYFLNVGVNGEHFNNKITAMPIDPATGEQKPIDVQSPYGWSVGHSIYDFYTRNFAGVDPATGVSTWTVYYADQNGDNKFTSGEQVVDLAKWNYDNPGKSNTLKTDITKTYSQATQYYIGKSALPKVRGAFNVNGGFKGFELDVQLLYSFGGYAYDYAYAGLMGNSIIGGNNWSTDIRRRWQKAGDITDVPRLSSDYDLNVTSSSSRFLTKADYISLNNIRLGYSLPSSLLQRTNFVDHATFFVSGDNLWLNVERNGFNPSTAEAGESNTYRYSPLSTITAGLQVKF
jgi:TonB-linked SusC/RagA family outer membrane protein